VGDVVLTERVEGRSSMPMETSPMMGGPLGAANNMGGGAGAATTVITKTRESAVITIGLIAPKEADALLEKAKQKPPAEAASAAVTARPAEQPVPPPTPPGAGPKR
jgi:hypothetical protein